MVVPQATKLFSRTISIANAIFHSQRFSSSYRPVDIQLRRKEKLLEITFPNAEKYTYPAEYLRAYSPAADSTPRQKVAVSGRRHVGILDVQLVGNYAIWVSFDDLHSTGMYTWQYLHDLGVNKFSYMRRYLLQLKTHGLSRDPLRDRIRNMSNLDKIDRQNEQ